MTKEEAIKELKEELKEVITWLAITINKEEMYERKERRKRAIEAAIKALEIVNDFETARIITGGRLNGRTYAYKCGLADGQRLAKGEKLFNILPPVTPQLNKSENPTGWIPVTERLPENLQRVLVTIVNYNDDKVVRVAEYRDNKRMFQIKENHEQWEVGEEGLLAWMPLPEPYKMESEG